MRLPVAAVMALSAALAAVSCQSTDHQPSAQPEQQSAQAQALEYVAIGDSYTAAPLVPSTDLAQSCLRSDGNYPHLIAEELPGSRLRDVSCSGADTADVTGRQAKDDRTLPPQIEAVTPGTDLVTIGIGANDFALFASLAVRCLEVAATAPEGSPCREANARPSGGDRLLDFVVRIEQRLVDVVRTVRERAPAATVVMVDYPRILPPSGTCPDLMPLAVGDYAYVGEVNEAVSDAVRAAADQAGVTSINLFEASRGHDVCSADPWVAGVRSVPGQALALHPFAAEQRAVADLVLAEL